MDGRDFFKDLYTDFYGNPDDSGKKPADPQPDSGNTTDGSNPQDNPIERAVDSIADMLNSALKRTQDALTELTSNVNGLPDLDVPGVTPPAGDINLVSPTTNDTPAPAQPTPSPAPDTNAAPAAQSEVQAETEAAAPEQPEEDPMEQLDKLIGLETIKHDVKELIDFVKIQKLRSEGGLKSVPVSLHLVFTGNPGTGKTTVARIIAKLYKQIGVLSKGQLVEVDRSGLVAGYVGQTALKTQEKIQEALGGVLFVDEAYALAGGDQDSFGQESINTILKAMEDNRNDLVVIVAGYTQPMEDFINSNPGLKSRFNKYIEFPDYTIDELEAIFYQNCTRYDYEVEDDARKHIRAMILTRRLTELENFANAREVRNMFEQIITNQARRVAAMDNPTADDLKLITIYDLTDEANGETLIDVDITESENTAESEADTAAVTEDSVTEPAAEFEEDEEPSGE